MLASPNHVALGPAFRKPCHPCTHSLDSVLYRRDIADPHSVRICLDNVVSNPVSIHDIQRRLPVAATFDILDLTGSRVSRKLSIEGMNQSGRCKIDLGKTEREEEVRRAAAARGAPPRGRRKLRIY